MNKLMLIVVFLSLMSISRVVAFSGYYEIVNKNSGMVLEVSGESTNDGVNVDQWIGNGGANQQWTLSSLGSGYYEIINKNSGLALEVYGFGTTNGANVDQWSYGGGYNQQWTVTSLGNGCYGITNRNSGKVLDLAGWSLFNGAIGINFDDTAWRKLDLPHDWGFQPGISW